MTAKLSFSRVGVRGGTKSWNSDVGQILLFMDGNGYDYIGADAFIGEGSTYRRRDKSQIMVKIGDKTWEGTKEELENILFPKTT